MRVAGAERRDDAAQVDVGGQVLGARRAVDAGAPQHALAFQHVMHATHRLSRFDDHPVANRRAIVVG
jgi:hypothetical protein